MQASFFTRHPFLKDVVSICVFIFLVLVGTLLINTFVFRSFSVVGPSMESTLYTNDRLIVNRLPVTWARLQNKQYMPGRDEVIVFKNPQFIPGSTDEYIVKRVIAFEGERVLLKDGVFTVYNDAHPGGFNPDESSEVKLSTNTSGSVNVVVPKGELFVAGDHRQGNYSLDSRNGLGTIPLYDVVGPVSLRIYPFDKIRAF